MSQANVMMMMSADERRVVEAIRRMNDRLDGTEQKTRRVKDASNELGGSMTRMAGAAIKDLRGMAAGLLGIGAAADLARRGIEQLNKVRDEAGEREKRNLPGKGALALAATSEQQYSGMIRAAELVRREGGAASVGEAAPLVAALRASGGLKYAPTFAALKDKGWTEDPAALASAAGGLQQVVGMRSGNLRDIVSKAIAAREVATKATLEGLVRGTTEAMKVGTGLGVSPDEAMAAVTVLAAGKGDAEEQGRQLATLMRGAAKAGAWKPGQSIEQFVSGVSAGRPSLRRLQEKLKVKGGVGTFNLLAANLEAEGQTLSNIATAPRRDIISQKLKWIANQPEMEAADIAEQEERILELQRDRYSVAKNLSQAISTRYIRQGEERFGLLGGAVTTAGDWFVRNFRDIKFPFVTDYEQHVQTWGSPHEKAVLDAAVNRESMAARARRIGTRVESFREDTSLFGTPQPFLAGADSRQVALDFRQAIQQFGAFTDRLAGTARGASNSSARPPRVVISPYDDPEGE